MIDVITERRIIVKRAEGKGEKRIAKELGISNAPIRRVIKEKANEIKQKQVELERKSDTLNEKILFSAKARLLKTLTDEDAKISPFALAQIVKSIDNILRLEGNKPTSITSKPVKGMTDEELINEARSIIRTLAGRQSGSTKT